MADNLDDGEFWLPPQFLTDDDASFANDGYNGSTNNLPAFFAPQNDDVSRAMFSYLSSPLESSETESSDEEEQQHMAELTRRFAHTTLGLDLSHSFPSQKPKGAVVSGSPQSTLCGCGGSPNGACHVTSQKATWDLLSAAAGEVERMRLCDAERRRFVENRASLVAPPPRNPGAAGFNNAQHNHHHSLSRQQLQIAQFELLRQQQMAKQEQGLAPVWYGAQNRVRNGEVGSSVVRGNAGLCASAWPPLQSLQKQHQAKQQQQYGSGMRAVFLGNPNRKRESTGTGVFLPRPVESKKKPACSTVLVPARVVQALNLKLEDMVPPHHHHQPRFDAISNMENASSVPRVRSNNYGFTQQKRNNLRMQPTPGVNHEIRLPQEWSY